VPDDAKPGSFPSGIEQVGFAPAIKADAQRVGFEDAVSLAESGGEPIGLNVVFDAAALAVLVADQVGRVREDEIGARCGRSFPCKPLTRKLQRAPARHHDRTRRAKRITGAT